MRFYDALSPTEKDTAIALARRTVVSDFCAGVLRLESGPEAAELQARIDALFDDLVEEDTLWAIEQELYNLLGEDIDALAAAWARETWYLEPYERAVHLPPDLARTEEHEARPHQNHRPR